jgi:hypothetical protein
MRVVELKLDHCSIEYMYIILDALDHHITLGLRSKIGNPMPFACHSVNKYMVTPRNVGRNIC